MSVLVKDTTAWTLGRICQCHPMAAREQLAPMMQVRTLDPLVEWASHF